MTDSAGATFFAADVQEVKVHVAVSEFGHIVLFGNLGGKLLRLVALETDEIFPLLLQIRIEVGRI